MSAPTLTSNLEAALAYAERFRWLLFPQAFPIGNSCSCGDLSCKHAGKHPIYELAPHGSSDASNYQAPIERWWLREPEANIGLACGKLSGVLAIDIDPRHGGADSFARLEAERGALPVTPTSCTGGGGQHRLFRYPGNAVTGGPLAAGVELKANDAVTLPPSRHVSGVSYAWAEGLSPWEVPLAELPEAWLPKRNGSARAQASTEERILKTQRRRRLLQLAASMRARGTSLEAIETAIREENAQRCDPPWEERELERKVRNIMRTMERYKGPAANDDPASGTDTGRGARLATIFGDRIRWCGARRKWYAFDGVRFAVDHGRTVEAFAKDLARLMLVEASATENSDDKARLAKHALVAAKGPGVRETVFLCRSESEVQVDPAAFDSDPYVLNTPSGTLNLRTMELREHEPGDLLTMATRAAYVPGARSEEWEQVLAYALPDDGLRDYFHRLCESFLEGTSQHDVLAAVHGPTGTGKSTVLRAVSGAMGDYSYATEYSTFARQEKRPGRATPELAALIGRRLVLAFEGSEGVELDSERVKRLTSGDPGSVRDLFQSEQEMTPGFKIVLVSNFRPIVKGDPALWRRLREVPFRHTVTDPDTTLRDRLRQDPAILAAVLSWMVEGYLRFKKTGLEQPESVTAATDEFRREADPFEGFLDEVCVLDQDGFTLTADLKRAYAAHTGDLQERPLDWDSEVVPRLKQRGCLAHRNHAGRGWRGIRIAEAAEQLTTAVRRA